MPTKTYTSRPTRKVAAQRWDQVERLIKPGKLLRVEHITRIEDGQFVHIWAAEYTKRVEFRSDDLPPAR